MDGLTPEQQALFSSIMGQAAPKPFIPPTPAPAPTPVAAPAPAAPAGNANRVLSQAEIDALIASMSG